MLSPQTRANKEHAAAKFAKEMEDCLHRLLLAEAAKDRRQPIAAPCGEFCACPCGQPKKQLQHVEESTSSDAELEEDFARYWRSMGEAV